MRRTFCSVHRLKLSSCETLSKRVDTFGVSSTNFSSSLFRFRVDPLVCQHSIDICHRNRDISCVSLIDLGALQIVLRALTGWLDHQEREAVAYFSEREPVVRNYYV